MSSVDAPAYNYVVLALYDRTKMPPYLNPWIRQEYVTQYPLKAKTYEEAYYESDQLFDNDSRIQVAVSFELCSVYNAPRPLWKYERM